MQQEPKFLFDECFARPAVKDIETVIQKYGGREGTFAHVLEYQGQGVKDDIWIPKLATDGWIVITGDRGKKPSPGSKLPLLCRAYRVTHVTLSGSLHQSKTIEKVAAIVTVADALFEVVAPAPRGSEFRLQYNSRKSGVNLVLASTPEEEKTPTQKEFPFGGGS